MNLTEFVVGLLFGACQEYLGSVTPPERSARRRNTIIVAYDSGQPSSSGVLNWGDMVDGEHDLWMLNSGYRWN